MLKSPDGRHPVVEIIDPKLVEIYRKMTPAERLKQAFDIWDFATVVMRASIRRDHPDWSVEQVQREIFRRVRFEDLNEAIASNVMPEIRYFAGSTETANRVPETPTSGSPTF